MMIRLSIPMKPWVKSTIATLISLHLVGGMQVRAADVPVNPVISVQVVDATAGSVPVAGSVAARKSVQFTAQMPGRVLQLAGKEGDRFYANTMLVQLDESELLAQRQIALAQWQAAYGTLQNAQMQYWRRLGSKGSSYGTMGGMGMPAMMDQLFTNPVSKMMGTRNTDRERSADIFAGGVQISQAQQSLAQASAGIQQIDTKIRDARSIAPFDGVIVKKLVEVGDPVQPGQPLLVFEDLTPKQVVVDIPEQQASRLSPGQQLDALVEANGKQKATVTVANIFPSSDPVRHTMRVKFDLSADLAVSAGNYAEVFIPKANTQTGSGKIIMVPGTAIAKRGGLPVIFALDGGQTVEMRFVRPGQILPDGNVIIDYGLTPTDRIVDNPAAWLVSGASLSAIPGTEISSDQ